MVCTPLPILEASLPTPEKVSPHPSKVEQHDTSMIIDINLFIILAPFCGLGYDLLFDS